MIVWLKRVAARALLSASGALLRTGLKLCESIPDKPPDELDDDDDLPAPPQDPLTDASREMMVDRSRPPKRVEPESEPPLAGSARERYVNARKRRFH